MKKTCALASNLVKSEARRDAAIHAPLRRSHKLFRPLSSVFR
jgi:hypothetical protein